MNSVDNLFHDAMLVTAQLLAVLSDIKCSK